MPIRRALAALSVLAAAACTTDGHAGDAAASGPTPAQGPTTGAAVTSGHGPTEDVPAFPRNTAVQTAENTGEWDLLLTDVRVGEHQGFDRVVLEFTGTGAPGWSVGYVDEAVLDGSGEVVPLDGDAILDVYASGTTWPAADGDVDTGPRQPELGSGAAVAAVHVAGTFEGSTQVLVGLDDGPVPFRTFALTDPARLVVDVRDDSVD